MQKSDGNFYEIQSDFEQYWSTRDRDEKGKGYKAFKRWENFVERRVFPSGDLSLLNLTAVNYAAFLQTQNTSGHGPGKIIGSGNNLIASATWTPMGPFGALSGTAGGQLLKSGRLGFITIDPTNTLNLWVGAPAGGLWGSTNGGASWTTNTDQLGVIGCSDLAIDPNNTNIMYLATGDGDAGDTRSIGVLKSTNAGATWSATGLTNVVSTNFLIRRLLINPANTQIVLAATNVGIYRTINGGTNWTLVNNQNTYDLEFKPGDPNTIYAGGTNFRLSTDGGATFNQITSGLPTTGVQRIAVAVTPADVNYVYLLASNSSNSGFLGLYRSTVSGTTFAVMSATTTTTLNPLGWNSNGGDVGGQGWYDLALAASPLNKDEIVVGGVNIWRSVNGGTNWTLYGHWVGGGAPFAHADQHDLEYATNGTLFGCNDGTVYQRTSTSWLEISGQMNISQIYKIGLSSLNTNRWITGHQDNGTSIHTPISYNASLGGDGMDCFIDRTNDQNCFGEYQNGSLMRSTNGGASWSSCTSGLSGSTPWVTIWKQDPQVAGTIYVGRVNLFKSTNQAASAWGTLTPVPGTVTIREFAIAPSNNQVIYVLKSTGIYKTTDGGVTWSNVTGTVPIASALPEFITIDPTDPNNAWVVLGGYSAGNKIFVTSNGGATWTNFSANLPNIPANCSVYQPGTNDVIYVGMDVGIYYRDNISAQWTLYTTGLPNVPIADMEISPASPYLLYAATYGRGVWVASVNSPPGSPLTSFALPSAGLCTGSAITFSDQSSNTPNAWTWSVAPNAGVSISSATLQNPTFTFLNPGTYTVNLVAANSIGQGTVYAQVATIYAAPNLIVTVPSKTVCSGSQVVFSASGAAAYNWSNGGGTAPTSTYFPLSNAVYTVSGITNSCTSIITVTASTLPLPIVSITGTNQSCSGDPVALTGNGAVSYTWSNLLTGPVISTSPTITTTYSVVGTDNNGCQSAASQLVLVFPLPALKILASDTVVCPEQPVTLNSSGAVFYLWMPSGLNGPTLTFIPTGNATYSCTGVDVNGCMNSAAISVSVASCENIAKFQGLNGIGVSVFPNPTKGKITIKDSKIGTTQVRARVLDLHSKVILDQMLQFNPADQTAELTISQLSAGTYFLKLSFDNDRTEVLRIIKE